MIHRRRLELDGDGKRVVEVQIEKKVVIAGSGGAPDAALWITICLCGREHVAAYAGEYALRADAGDSDMLDNIALDGLCDACFDGARR